PAVVKVNDQESPAKRIPLKNQPGPDVDAAVWGAPALFVQVTVVPTLTVSVLGTKPPLVMDILLPAGVGVGVGVLVEVLVGVGVAVAPLPVEVGVGVFPGFGVGVFVGAVPGGRVG